ncbi:hypothetical protein F2Q69_00050117 [Brassica cretica]|uniref:Uncharacterized protein n=1 Tax=Brassica cretica TaxID=69181 RepID=A0A8S9PRS9_BRACR|nr:hypothetical protein F2Q69_00050117 [Brassica cretica]
MNIKRMVDDFQQVAKSNQNIQTVEDMGRFVDNYPEYKKMQGNVSKHVTLITEMSKLLEARKLMLVSQTEQDLACNGGQGAAYEAVTDLLNNESVSDIDRLRLVMLYALRYEKENPVQLRQLFNKLASRSPKYKPGAMSNLAPFKLQLVQFLLKQGGVEKRTDDLFRNRDLMNIARNMARGLMGVENVYTQHQPPVSYNGKHNHREITRCGLTFCWRSFSTGTVCATYSFFVMLKTCLKLIVSNVSIVYSQSELLRKEVFLVEMDTQIHILADSDEHEAVQQVQEFYADFVAGDPSHFTLNMPSTHLYMLPAVVDPSSLQRYSDRVVDGIVAVFLALKRRPVLRYQRTYDTAKRIAHETANPREQLEIVELQYMPYISSCIMSAADMAVVIQWFPGNRRPEHMTFYVIHYQLVYESKHVNSTLCLALQTSPATQRKSLLSQTLSDLQIYFATSNVCYILCLKLGDPTEMWSRCNGKPFFIFSLDWTSIWRLQRCLRRFSKKEYSSVWHRWRYKTLESAAVLYTRVESRFMVTTRLRGIGCNYLAVVVFNVAATWVFS